MQQICGHRAAGSQARLDGYQCLRLHGLSYPAIRPRTSGQVAGRLYAQLTSAQLAAIDRYEGNVYQRRPVTVCCGDDLVQAWAYVLLPRYYHRLARQSWVLEAFVVRDLKAYSHRHHWKRVLTEHG